MQVTLYNSSSDPRRVNKLQYLTAIATVNAVPYYPLNIESPVLDIKYVNGYTNINYAYIPELSRYYFVQKPLLTSGQIIKLPCECDVLMSHRVQILDLDCICTRNQSRFNPYIQDDFPCSVKATTTNYIMLENTPFAMPDDSQVSYIMTLNGLVGGS